MTKSNTAVKHDSKKIRTDLFSTLALEEVAKVLAFGAEKYTSDNWRLGMDWRRLIGASIRHIFAFMRGDDNDEETGLSHIAHAMCCLMFLLEYQITNNGHDDRWNERYSVPLIKRSNKPVTKRKESMKDAPSSKSGPARDHKKR